LGIFRLETTRYISHVLHRTRRPTALFLFNATERSIIHIRCVI